MLNPIKHSYWCKVEIGLKDFTLGVKAEIQKNVFNLPQVTNKCYVPSYKTDMGKITLT
jgi:hypothetical protein